jgi:sugar phosphate permease
MGHVSEPWHIYLLFPLMGVGWACLSTTAVATTLASWFEKYQGRAVSIASLGASAGGMMGPPLLLLGADRIGFARTTAAAAAVMLVVLLPLVLFVLRRRPEDMGLSPDGLPRAQDIRQRQSAPQTSAQQTRAA